MLLKYSVKNFRSFRNEATLDMMCSDNSVLKTAIFMGANASGKSNFLKSIFISSFFIKTNKAEKTEGSDSIKAYDSYINNGEPVEYKYLFSEKMNKEEIFVDYSFSVIRKNEDEFIISDECLKIGNNINNLGLAFKRYNNGNIETYCENKEELSENICDNCENKKNLCEKIRNVNEIFIGMGKPTDNLFLNILMVRITTTSNEIDAIRNFFRRLKVADFDVYVRTNPIEEVRKLAKEGIFENNESKSKFIYFLRLADSTVKDINISEPIKVTHDIENNDIELPLLEESGGLKIFIGLFSTVYNMLRNRNVFIIDELDSRLHFDLISYLVELIDKNNIGTQLIFTCHNIGALHWNLKNESYNFLNRYDGISFIKRADNVLVDNNKDERVEAYMNGELGGMLDYTQIEKHINLFEKGNNNVK